MSQLGLTLARAHHNRQLFSNHFLEKRLRSDTLWTGIAEQAEEVRQRLGALLAAQEDALNTANEAQTEERFIRPVLEILGWGWEVQPRSTRQGQTQFPDYALFPDAQAANDAAAQRDRRHVLKRGVGVLEAKRWGRGLDVHGAAGDLAPNRVPSAQIINYLIRAEQPWGILTNGLEWRLYHRDADFADTVYFAVDLPALLGKDPLPLGEGGEQIPAAEAFRYFLLFFRPAAFSEGPSGKRWLDVARESSTKYARAVEEALKPRAYRAVTALCAGFVAGAEISVEDLAADETLGRMVLDNALTVLFRLLFLLYAESRELLPVRTLPAYRRKSLMQLRERAAAIRDEGEQLFPRGRDLWNDLRDLSRIVEGHDEWRLPGLPVYDGGLFDSAQHVWLEDHYVADPQLAEALDFLSRVEDPETHALHMVDFSPLDVRHLGSIYEGLLEYVVRVAEEPLPDIRERGRVVRDPVAPGAVYLATDKGERKTSGSYYTPDYIVQYITERTLGPLVEGRSPDGVLALKVLDPAMGSGHFLVAATSYLARAAVQAVETSEQALLGDFARLDPEDLRRLVVERCIFGVDRNPRAVELAKLALWLATVQRDKPLNFLDHHLRCGDSLLGGWMDEMGSLPGRKGQEAALEAEGQFNAFESALRQELGRALHHIELIERLASDDLGQVMQKKRAFAEAEAVLRRCREAADLWASRLFGNEVTEDAYTRLLWALKAPVQEWERIRDEPWMERARALAAEHRFFHWEVEFGEIFHDTARGGARENPGFDAVVGNPPYVRMEEFKGIKDFLRPEYQVYATRADLYVYFIERSLDLLRSGGEYGVVVSNKFLRANYGKAVRGLIGERAGVREIVDFGGLPVFPEATVRAALVFARLGHVAEPPRLAELASLDFASLDEAVNAAAFGLDRSACTGADWALTPLAHVSLLNKLSNRSTDLARTGRVLIGRGVVTGLNEAFFLSDETAQAMLAADPVYAEVVKPLVVGSDVRRYHVEQANAWLLYLPHGIDISRYPLVEAHLEPFRERLEKRATKQAWYELQQPQEAYQEYFEAAKILYPDIGTVPRFALDRGPAYPTNTTYFLSASSDFLVAVLNSRISHFYFAAHCAQLEGSNDSYLRFFTQYIEQFPVRRIADLTSDESRDESVGWLQALYHRGLRRAGVDVQIPEEIRALGARIGEVNHVERVLLVGSWARGQGRDDSDLDLLVVGGLDGGRSRQAAAIRRHLGEVGRPLDLHYYTQAEVDAQRQQPGSFLSNVMAEGIELYARG